MLVLPVTEVSLRKRYVKTQVVLRRGRARFGRVANAGNQKDPFIHQRVADFVRLVQSKRALGKYDAINSANRGLCIVQQRSQALEETCLPFGAEELLQTTGRII